MFGWHGSEDGAVAYRALMEAVERADESRVASLLAGGADPNGQGVGDISALIRAADEGQATIAMLLVRAGAWVDYQDDTGNTPLNCAASSGSPEIVRLLLAAGADMNGRNRFGVTPSVYAADHPDVARLLALAGMRGESAQCAKQKGWLAKLAAWG